MSGAGATCPDGVSDATDFSRSCLQLIAARQRLTLVRKAWQEGSAVTIRRLLAIAVLLLLIPLPHAVAAADTAVTVLVEDQPVSYDVAPAIVDGRVMVPLRFTLAALGASVDWHADQQKIYAYRGGIRLELTIGQRELLKNGKPIALDVAPYIDNGRTLVPLRAVAEGLQCQVDWDGDTRTVRIDPSPGALSTQAVQGGPTGGLLLVRQVPGGLLGAGATRLFQSQDGRSWQEIPLPYVDSNIVDLARTGSGALFVVHFDRQLQRSDDGGKSWQGVDAVPRAAAIAVRGERIYVAGRHVPAEGQPLPGLYRSDDGGATWSVYTDGFWPGRLAAVAVDAAAVDTLYASVSDYDMRQRGGGLFKSTDGGKTWVHSSQGLDDVPWEVLTDPTQGGVVYARGGTGLYRSTDGAATWQKVLGQFWYQGAGGVQAWQGSVSGLPAFAAVALPDQHGLMVLTDMGGAGSTFAGPGPEGPWEQAGAGLPALQVRFVAPYAVAGRALFRSGRFMGALPADSDWTLAVSPLHSDHLWALPTHPVENSMAAPGYESTDGGKSWHDIGQFGPSFFGPVLALSDSFLLARIGPDLQRSEDGGRTWQGAGPVGANNLALGAGGRIWAGSERGAAYSDDGAQTWTWTGFGLPGLNVRAISPDPAKWAEAVALTDGGIACTVTSGKRWYSCEDGLPPVDWRQAARLARSPGGTLYLAVDHLGAWRLADGAWQALRLPRPDGLKDLNAADDDLVQISQNWNTMNRQVTAPAAAGKLPPPPPPTEGVHWSEPALGGANVASLYVSTADPQLALAVTSQHAVALTRDGGQTWSQVGTMPAGATSLTLSGVPAGRYLADGWGSAVQTRDGGKTWELIAPYQEVGMADIFAVRPDPDHPDVLLAGYQGPLMSGGSSGVIRSTDGGKTWTHVYSPTNQVGRPVRRIGGLVRSAQDPTVVYASGDVFAISHDGGSTWQESEEPATVLFSDAQGTLYGIDQGKPSISTDGAQSWQPVGVPEGVRGDYLLVRPTGASGRWLAHTGFPGGMWLTNNSGQNWTDLTADLGDPAVWAVAPAGGGAWYVRLSNGLLFRLEA